MNADALKKFVAPLVNRIQMMIGKAVLSAIDDSRAIQIIQVRSLDGEVLDGVEHLQPFGLSGNCPADGSSVLIGFIGGNRDNPVAIVVDSGTHRPQGLKEGESQLYSAHGSHVYLRDDGSIEIVTNGSAVNVHGDVAASGDVLDSVGALDAVRQDLAQHIAEYNTHVHTGVTSGPSLTGPPAA